MTHVHDEDLPPSAALHPDRWLVRVPRLMLAVAVIAALTRNTIRSALGIDDSTLPRHFSLFTVQSNFFLVVVLLINVLRPRHLLPRWWDDVRGATTFYLVMTGLVYALLVAPPGEFWQIDIGWSGLILHRIAPLVAFADWALVANLRRAGWWRPVAWLGYPVLFLCYTWIRGAIVRWYPYDFLDPLKGGWAPVLRMTAIVLLAFLIVAVILHLIGLWRARRTAAGRSRHDG